MPPRETAVETSVRPSGRRRDPEVDRRIRNASIEGLAAEGFSGLTIDKICVRAGVPRATFYRRWDSLYAAVADAFHEAFLFKDLAESEAPLDDIVAFFLEMVALYNAPVIGPCMGLIVQEARLRPELEKLTTAHFVARRARNRAYVASALARLGRPDAVDPDLLVDVLSGLAMNTMATGRKVSRRDAELVVRRLIGLPG